MAHYKFMISGGGTGGHIFPAIAIADKLREMEPESEFLFVGAQDRMEMDRVPQAGYKIEGLWISGIQRKLTASNMAFPFKLLSSIIKSQKLIKRFKPDVVIGTGGFASGPLLIVASRKKIPTLIQEQNSLAGITNKMLGKKVHKVCVAYENMDAYFPAGKILLTGNPIREAVKNINPVYKDAMHSFGLNPERKTLLVLGGSLGARRINELIATNLEQILKHDINLIWQTGKLYFDNLNAKFSGRTNDQFQLLPFIKNMENAYASQYVISRAGAGTISELSVAGKATMLIPSPNVAEDHQTKNAMAMVGSDAALMFRESETNEAFLKTLDDLLTHSERLERNMIKLAKPNAAEDIAKEILKLAQAHVK